MWAGTPAAAGPGGWVAADAGCLLALQWNPWNTWVWHPTSPTHPTCSLFSRRSVSAAQTQCDSEWTLLNIYVTVPQNWALNQLRENVSDMADLFHFVSLSSCLEDDELQTCSCWRFFTFNWSFETLCFCATFGQKCFTNIILTIFYLIYDSNLHSVLAVVHRAPHVVQDEAPPEEKPRLKAQSHWLFQCVREVLQWSVPAPGLMLFLTFLLISLV